MSIREVARRTGLSKNTVKKYLRDDRIEPLYPERDEVRKIDAHAETLAGWLKADAAKPRRERRTARALHQALVGLGFSGDYSRVTEFVRGWHEAQGRVR